LQSTEINVAVLGTGVVGQTLATKLVAIGHPVTMGPRQAGNEKAAAWAAPAGDLACEGSFADAASSGALDVNATSGMASLDALAAPLGDFAPGAPLAQVIST